MGPALVPAIVSIVGAVASTAITNAMQKEPEAPVSAADLKDQPAAVQPVDTGAADKEKALLAQKKKQQKTGFMETLGQQATGLLGGSTPLL